MGAALTYARRYALFTLVGIAGEDDIDAPDLKAPMPPASVAAANATAELDFPLWTIVRIGLHIGMRRPYCHRIPAANAFQTACRRTANRARNY